MNRFRQALLNGFLAFFGAKEPPRTPLRPWKRRLPLRKPGIAGDIAGMMHDRAMLDRDMEAAARRLYREMNPDEQRRLDARLQSAGLTSVVPRLRNR